MTKNSMCADVSKFAQHISLKKTSFYSHPSSHFLKSDNFNWIKKAYCAINMSSRIFRKSQFWKHSVLILFLILILMIFLKSL